MSLGVISRKNTSLVFGAIAVLFSLLLVVISTVLTSKPTPGSLRWVKNCLQMGDGLTPIAVLGTNAYVYYAEFLRPESQLRKLTRRYEGNEGVQIASEKVTLSILKALRTTNDCRAAFAVQQVFDAMVWSRLAPESDIEGDALMREQNCVETMNFLVQMLASSHPVARLKAAGYLINYGTSASNAVPLLIRECKNFNNNAPYALVAVSPELSSSAQIIAAASIQATGNWQFRGHAAKALHSLGHRASTVVLEVATLLTMYLDELSLNDTRSKDLQAGVVSLLLFLAASGDDAKDAIPVIERCLKADAATIQIAASYAYWKTTGAASVPVSVLTSALKESDDAVVFAFDLAYGIANPVKQIVMTEKSAAFHRTLNLSCQSAAGYILGEITSGASPATLEALKSVAVQTGTLQALFASRAIAKISGNHDSYVVYLRNELADDYIMSNGFSRRIAVAYFLADLELSASPALPELQEMANSASGPVKYAAEYAISKILKRD